MNLIHFSINSLGLLHLLLTKFSCAFSRFPFPLIFSDHRENEVFMSSQLKSHFGLIIKLWGIQIALSASCYSSLGKLVVWTVNPAVNYMFQVSNRNTRTRCGICSKLTINIIFIVNFEHISHLILEFLLLTLRR